MKADYWHNLWDTDDIGFHMKETNKFLLKFFSLLKLEKNSRVFIPLCGKTKDIKWLLDNGYRVVGAELNENAIKELFDFLGLEVTTTNIGSLILYSSKNIDIFVGDIFKLDKTTLGKVDAIYDRAAIVALPTEMRKQYTSLLLNLTDNVPQLIVSLDYVQSLMEGPPFSVKEPHLKDYYSDFYNLKLLDSHKFMPFEEINAVETVWLLSCKNNLDKGYI